MKIDAKALREQYDDKDTEELVALQRQGGLTEVAECILHDVLQSRGVTSEIREVLGDEIEQRTRERSKVWLANPGLRLTAQLIDTVVAFGLMLVPFALIDVEEAAGPIGLATFLAYWLFADALPRGQSVGKKLLRIAAVDEKTEKACTLSQSLARNATGILGIIDWIFIVGQKRQRLGDRVAGTVVVNRRRGQSTPG